MPRCPGCWGCDGDAARFSRENRTEIRANFGPRTGRALMDRRLTPANGRVAALWLAGRIEAERYVPGTPARVIRPVLDIRAHPGGPRERQVLFGAEVTVYEEREGWSFIQAGAHGYVGYVESPALGAPLAATHHVATPATHIYADDNLKSRDLAWLPFGADVHVVHEAKAFFQTPDGFIPKKHLWPVAKRFSDPATAAQLFFGVPYLWGGDSTLGIDCSGLVHAALTACGLPCPPDSDLQRALGQPATGALRRGDLWFWRGHVAMAVDETTLIHASGHHMAVVYEGAEEARLRIQAQDGGEVIAHRRLAP
jgi:cell wall-associated NlpC family hydrolase